MAYEVREGVEEMLRESDAATLARMAIEAYGEASSLRDHNYSKAATLAGLAAFKAVQEATSVSIPVDEEPLQHLRADA